MPRLPPVITAFQTARHHAALLPHEWAFGGWLTGVGLWLGIRQGWTQVVTLEFLACAVVSLGLVLWCAQQPTSLRWRIRLLWYPSVMGLSFYSLPVAIQALGRPNADALLAGIDQQWLGEAAAQRLQWLASPAVTDGLLTAYLFFFVVLVWGPGYYCTLDLARFRACMVGLFVVYALGFSGYVALPAAGPYRYLADQLPPLPLGPLSRLMRPVIGGASNGVDVFPSIHFAASCYLWVFDYWHHRRRFWLWAMPILALWLSTVYLRYHYAVDLLAGAVVASVGLWVSAAYWRREQLADRAADQG